MVGGQGPGEDSANQAENDPPSTTPRSLLFFCGRNSIRSPMAELLARKSMPPTTFLTSAGVRTGVRDPFVDAVLEEEGLSLGDHVPRKFEELEDSYFDLIITLSPEAHHQALELTRTQAVEVEYWPTFDPSVIEGSREQILRAYRELRDHLKEAIAARFPSKSSD